MYYNLIHLIIPKTIPKRLNPYSFNAISKTKLDKCFFMVAMIQNMLLTIFNVSSSLRSHFGFQASCVCSIVTWTMPFPFGYVLVRCSFMSHVIGAVLAVRSRDSMR